MAKKNKKVRIFESAIERIARVLSKKWNIKVIFQHDRCETSGSTIYLPTLPENASKELMDAMQGHLDHEAAHVVYTDFSSLKRVRRNPKTMTVLNALEDPRIEAKWCKLYPGAKTNLRRSHEWALEKVSKEQEMVDPEDGQKKMMKPWDNLSSLGKFLHASITYTCSNFDDSHWFLNDIVEDHIFNDVKKYSTYFREALSIDNTNDLIPLAKELLQKLGEEDPETEEPEQLEDGDQIPDNAVMMPAGGGGGGRQSPQGSVMSKQPQGGAGSGAGGMPSAVEVAPSMEADEQNAAQDEDDASKGGQPGGSSGQPGSKYDVSDEDVQHDEEVFNRNDALKDAARRELSRDDVYLVYSTEGDEIERIREGDRVEYKKFMQKSVKLVGPMKRKLARSMLSTKESRWEGDKTRGKINPRRLYQVPMGTSKRIFRSRVQSEDFDTCVMMMVDHSSSMSGYQLDLAAKTAIVFGELLSQLGIPFSVLGFSTGTSGVSQKRKNQASTDEQCLYKRWGNLWIGEYKNFEDSWQSAGPKMINMVNNSRNNTYDGESLRYGAQLLLARPEKRKIMFWMNDGQPCPNWADDTQAHNRYALDCAKEVEKMIELFAIGINTDAVKSYYKNCVQVNDLEDLPKTCLHELDQLIRKGKSYRS